MLADGMLVFDGWEKIEHINKTNINVERSQKIEDKLKTTSE